MGADRPPWRLASSPGRGFAALGRGAYDDALRLIVRQPGPSAAVKRDRGPGLKALDRPQLPSVCARSLGCAAPSMSVFQPLFLLRRSVQVEIFQGAA